VGARRKSACRTSNRRSAAPYGDEGEAEEGRPRDLDGVGSGVEGKRKDGCAESRGGTASRRCGAWRSDMAAGGGSGWRWTGGGEAWTVDSSSLAASRSVCVIGLPSWMVRIDGPSGPNSSGLGRTFNHSV
jgi:hypothetical protein